MTTITENKNQAVMQRFTEYVKPNGVKQKITLKSGILTKNCFRRDTTFWTDKGVKTFKDFEDGDIVNIRGENDWLPATIRSCGEQELIKITVGKRDEKRNIFTTANHRWICELEKDSYKIKTTNELQVGWQLKNFYRHKKVYILDFQLPIATINWKVINVKHTGIKEQVWCVVEPEFEEFTLGCGILTKNCTAINTKMTLEHL